MKVPQIISFVITTLIICLGCKNEETNSSPAKEVNTLKKEVVKKLETTNLKVDGMTCAIGCAKTIEENLSKAKGVQKAVVDFDSKIATVTFDANKTSEQNLVVTIESSADGETFKVIKE